ncbi:MAG: polyamine aminopropyltransferase [Thermanaerothrix sp.]|nr:polyamine aminopropyltransferase [Thermanaerothrix sp.]
MEVRPKRLNEMWLFEEQTHNMKLGLRMTQVLRNIKSQYQDLLVVETPEYGKVMVLDGAIQVTERDEFCYHEMMSHLALCSHPNPEKVLIVGGGDGGTLREVLRHDSVKEAYLVDIDEEVIRAAKDFFPSLSCAMDDPRARVLPMDALKFIEDNKEAFDVVIVDSTDPVEFAAGLFEAPFYANVHRSLREDGFIVCQTESPFSDPHVVTGAYEALRQVFKVVKLAVGFMPTYPTGFWTYGIGTKGFDPQEIRRPAPEGTRYYSHEIHRAAFVLPPFLKAMLG